MSVSFSLNAPLQLKLYPSVNTGIYHLMSVCLEFEFHLKISLKTQKAVRIEMKAKTSSLSQYSGTSI